MHPAQIDRRAEVRCDQVTHFKIKTTLANTENTCKCREHAPQYDDRTHKYPAAHGTVWFDALSVANVTNRFNNARLRFTQGTQTAYLKCQMGCFYSVLNKFYVPVLEKARRNIGKDEPPLKKKNKTKQKNESFEIDWADFRMSSLPVERVGNSARLPCGML